MATEDFEERLRQSFPEVANNPSVWEIKASELLTASRVLKEARQRAFEQVYERGEDGSIRRISDNVPEEYWVGFSRLMLLGFAVECLMKALYLHKGNALFDECGDHLPRHHKLDNVANELGLANLFSKSQKAVLRRLGQYIESLGRYPVPKRDDEYARQQMGSIGWTPEYEQVSSDVVEMLLSEIEKRKA